MSMLDAANDGSPGLNIGPFEMLPGVRRRHFNSLLLASFFTIGLMTLVGNLQPYLFNAVLHVPRVEQGSLSGSLATVNELVFLALVSFLGALSDKTGRRPIYALGFAVMAFAYVLYPLAARPAQLFAFRMVFAAGAAAVSAMLAAVVADYPRESSRGKLVGLCFFINGIGIALLVVLAGKLPQIIQNFGATPVQAGRCAYWSVAALCLVPLLIVAFGLMPGAPAQASKRQPALATLRTGIRAARDPRVALAYLSATVARGDLAIISTFFLLWLTQVGMSHGLAAGAAQAKGVVFFGITQVVATFWALAVIFFIDRFDRVLALAVAMVLASAAYLGVGMIEDPLGRNMYFAAAFLGVGEMSGVLASQALIGQVSGERGRGAVIGVYSLCGSVGILLATFCGGILFDAWRPSAPYILMGIADAVLAVIAFAVYFATRARVATVAARA